MRTITLELLRHGPSHNQLLSPLTRYLGLCGNHPAVSVSVPFEHSHFLTRLRALEYRDSRKTGEMQLRDTAASLAEMMSTIPGLIAELANRTGDDSELTHLRLVLSATELALLPFEISDAPNGFPGAGQSLLLQSQVPLCVTREVRRVSNAAINWPRKPRILFAAAAPEGVGEIPVEAHLLALRQVIEPWVYHYDSEDERREKIGEHLTFLPRATVEKISSHCRDGDYTHIHLLAHGVQFEEGDDRRYALALHSRFSASSADKVDGVRLAKTLRTHTRLGGHGLTRPAVVTIASCQSGNVGSVVGAGASIAHALHEEGVPLVIASQFPLSFAGSVIMTRVLYEGLLRGTDPRLLLNDLRRRLKTEIPKTHDWASIVAYATFPANFDQQLMRIRIHQAYRSIEAALNHADRASREMSGQYTASSTWDKDDSDPTANLSEPLERLADAKNRLWDLLSDSTDEKVWINGLLASTEKRLAEIHWRAITWFTTLDHLSTIYKKKSLYALERARESYRRAFEADGSQSWASVQDMCLTAIMDGGRRISEDTWNLARLLSERDLSGENRQRQAWAHSNMIELLMLTRLMENGDALALTLDPLSKNGDPVAEIPPGRIKEIALDHARDLLKARVAHSAEVYSTRRQMLRYVEFFADVYAQSRNTAPLEAAVGESKSSFDDIIDIAKAVYDELPEPEGYA